MDKFHLQIVAKYFTSSNTFITFASINTKCQDVLAMFHFNPIDRTDLFPNIETQYVRNDSQYDRKFPRHRYCRRVSYAEYLEKKDRYDEFQKVVFDFYSYAKKVGKENIKQKLILPPIITGMSSYAFEGVTSLTSIVLSSTIKTIPDNCFNGCSNLVELNLPETIISIGGGAFFNTNKLSSLLIPSSVTSIENEIFNRNNGLISFRCYASTTLPRYFFQVMSKLTDIIIRKTKKVHYLIPHRFTQFFHDQGVEYGDTYYCHVDVVHHIKENKQDVNRDGNLQQITIPEDIIEICSNTFQSFYSLTSINFSTSIVRIGQNAFRGCSSLTSIDLPQSITRLEYGAFQDCRQLSGVTIPENCKLIDDYAFAGCRSLQTMNILGNVKKIHCNTLCNCTNLTVITFHKRIAKFHKNALDSCDNLIFMKSMGDDTKTPLNYRVGLYFRMGGMNNPMIYFTNRDLDIYRMYNPHHTQGGSIRRLDLDCVHKLQPALCMKWKYLREVVLGGTLTDLPKKCFAECMNLTSVVIPSSVTIIHNKCFRHSSNLKSIVLPNNIHLLSKCFEGCNGLTSVRCNGTIANIGNDCFRGCHNLISFECDGIRRCYRNAFGDTPLNITTFENQWKEMIIVEKKEKAKKQKKEKKMKSKK